MQEMEVKRPEIMLRTKGFPKSTRSTSPLRNLGVVLMYSSVQPTAVHMRDRPLLPERPSLPLQSHQGHNEQS
ncbi:hypothetical protein DPMN_056060 [Dreissena polymorpha]|uniref:Uncharacterized protein n=1 Tax=Dreissena polymorpha TaxID=45954 RepID=A0A9D4CSH7_DREPO|nr:hypothetical protein DPMN_056060 [Dreissena polymorpha]